MQYMSASTNLFDRDDEPFVLGPYRFASEEAMSAWKDELDEVLAGLNYELMQPYAGGVHIIVLYEQDVPVRDAKLVPPVAQLVADIRERWESDELSLRLAALAA